MRRVQKRMRIPWTAMKPEKNCIHQEAAEELRAPQHVHQMVSKGELSAEKFGRDLMITRVAVTEAKERKTTPGPAPAAHGSARSQIRKKS